jgi:membrane-bound serine protease (ClpP class)
MALRRRLHMFLLVAVGCLAVFTPAGLTLSEVPKTQPPLVTTEPASGDVSSSDERPSGPFVDIVEVAGWIDPVNARFIRDSLDKAKRDGAQALVLQLDTPGSRLTEDQRARLTAALSAGDRVPLLVWVGPSGARARRGALDLVAAADVVAVAGNTYLGPAIGPDPQFADGEVSATEALKRGIADLDAPTLGEFIGQLDGRNVGGLVLDTANEEAAGTENGRQQIPLRTVRFQQLGLLDQLLHTATNPGIVYLLFAIGLALMVFEFFTGGVGLAAGIGLVCFATGVYGLGILPTTGVGVGLMLLSFIGFGIDVQAGHPKFWTGIGTISLVVGSVLLFDEGVRVPFWWIGIVAAMVVTFMVAGMPTMIRTRFATPTIGRESMIGETGVAKTAVSPDGVVIVRGAPWKARTNRATPIAVGEALRIASIDGLVLEVEPLEGAAKTHRG